MEASIVIKSPPIISITGIPNVGAWVGGGVGYGVGQAALLQFFVWCNEGQTYPPRAAWVMIGLDLLEVPPPQLCEHAPHLDHRPTSQ